MQALSAPEKVMNAIGTIFSAYSSVYCQMMISRMIDLRLVQILPVLLLCSSHL